MGRAVGKGNVCFVFQCNAMQCKSSAAADDDDDNDAGYVNATMLALDI
jgi:hypothetical protein